MSLGLRVELVAGPDPVPRPVRPDRNPGGPFAPHPHLPGLVRRLPLRGSWAGLSAKLVGTKAKPSSTLEPSPLHDSPSQVTRKAVSNSVILRATLTEIIEVSPASPSSRLHPTFQRREDAFDAFCRTHYLAG